MTTPAAPAIPRSLFIYSIFYGGMVCIAGVLGAKQVTLPFGLAVEAGIFPFLLLVVLSSSVAELHGRATANRLVRFGFVPLITAIAMIWVVIQLPTDPSMYEPAKPAFPIILGQSWRLMGAGIVAYGVSQFLNVYIFSRLRGNDEQARGGLWLAGRAAIASAISQIVDTLIFITISFYDVRPIQDLLLGQAAAKVLLSFVLVPFLITGFVLLGRRIDGRAR
ncbi:MAG: queuosine precursor transporter [Sphingomonadales bacterium]|nr:queuosine precursor transporter [Sphingomonadales bacterium]